jgi:hypothetical protein
LDNSRRRAPRISCGLQHPGIGTIFSALPGMTDAFILLAIEHGRR